MKYTSTNTANESMYHEPELIHVELKEKSVELIFRQISKIAPLGTPGEVNIFKEIYVVKGGKLVHSKRVEGEYVPPKEESFKFKN